MTDAELIARLRKADEYEPLGHDGWEAADRIEELHNEWRFNANGWSDALARIEALTEQLAAARQDAHDAEDELELQEQEACMMENGYIKLEKERDALEAKLAKAVELALEECPFRHGTPKYNDWWHHRRATLAEIKGESHE